MALCVIYPNDEGKVCLLRPTGVLSVEETALKDVPAGTPYRIIDEMGLPDLMFQEAWVVDFSSYDGVGLGHDAWVAQRSQEVAA